MKTAASMLCAVIFIFGLAGCDAHQQSEKANSQNVNIQPYTEKIPTVSHDKNEKSGASFDFRKK